MHFGNTNQCRQLRFNSNLNKRHQRADCWQPCSFYYNFNADLIVFHRAPLCQAAHSLKRLAAGFKPRRDATAPMRSCRHQTLLLLKSHKVRLHSCAVLMCHCGSLEANCKFTSADRWSSLNDFRYGFKSFFDTNTPFLSCVDETFPAPVWCFTAAWCCWWMQHRINTRLLWLACVSSSCGPLGDKSQTLTVQNPRCCCWSCKALLLLPSSCSLYKAICSRTHLISSQDYTRDIIKTLIVLFKSVNLSPAPLVTSTFTFCTADLVSSHEEIAISVFFFCFFSCSWESFKHVAQGHSVTLTLSFEMLKNVHVLYSNYCFFYVVSFLNTYIDWFCACVSAGTRLWRHLWACKAAVIQPSAGSSRVPLMLQRSSVGSCFNSKAAPLKCHLGADNEDEQTRLTSTNIR